MIFNDKKKLIKYKKDTAITLIALIITIVILIILAGITIGAIFGENSLIKRAQESSFKSKMSAIAEEWNLYKSNLIINQEDTNIYAGDILKEIISSEELEEYFRGNNK